MPEPIEVTNMKKNCEDREYVLKNSKRKWKIIRVCIRKFKR